MPWWWTFGEVAEIDAEELNQQVEQDVPMQIVDVRTEGEYLEGHIKGAVLCSYLPNIFSFPGRLQDLNVCNFVNCWSDFNAYEKIFI